MKLSTSLENWLGWELARCSVQSDECNNQLLIDKVRVIERVGTCWDDDQFDRSEKLLDKLPLKPYRIQRALARTKHGALLLIDRLTSVYDSIDSSLGLDESQYKTLQDLIGIDNVFRKGSTRVPAATAVGELRATVTREIEKHRLNLERTLNARSDSEKEMAQMGLTRFRDSITRSLRSDLNRARQRFNWALETIALLKSGADPAKIIDPQTGRPVAVGPRPAVVPDPARPNPQPPPQPSAQPSPQPAPATAPAPRRRRPQPCHRFRRGVRRKRKRCGGWPPASFRAESATSDDDELRPPPPTA